MPFETKIKSISIFGVLLAGLLYLLSAFPWIAVVFLLLIVYRTVLKYKSFPIGQPAHATKRNPTQRSNSRDIKPKVAIIGAGPAGLAAAGAIQAKGIPCIIFEKESTVAPAWYRHYDRLHLHTTKITSSLPFVPFPENYPLFPSRQQVIDYLESYVKLMKINICFDHELIEAKYNFETKEWNLKLKLKKDNKTIDYTVKYLIIATGQNARNRPVEPFPGQDQFQGQIIHASQYKSGEVFQGKRVLIVGFGNTGAELAIDLWEHNATVSVVIRSPINIVIRDEMAKNAWLLPIVHYIPTWLLVLIAKFLLPKKPHGDLSKYNVISPRSDYTAIEGVISGKQTPSIDIGQWDLIKKGEIKVYRGISRFTQDGVFVTEGQHIPLDVVIFATGYTHSFEDFLPSDLTKKLIDPTNPHHVLYSGVEVPFQENLWFIGFHDVVGRLFEINWEARQIAKNLVKKERIQNQDQHAE